MGTYTLKRWMSRFGLVVVLLVFLIAGTVRAQEQPINITIGFNQTLIGIGQTAKLTIVFANVKPDPIRVTSLQCTQSGSAATASAISPMPGTVGVDVTFLTTQSYRGVSTGTITVNCNLTAVNTVTGATYTATNLGPSTLNVIPEMGLGFTAYSATQVATVGQSVFVISKFVNRGKTAYTNLNLSCVELGRALISVSQAPLPSILLPGQSGFVEDRWLAVRTGGGPISCAFTATESSSGKSVTLLAPTIQIVVK